MRILVIILLLHTGTLFAGTATVTITAPGQAGAVAVLYRYDDLFSRRTVRIADGLLDKDARTTLSADVEGTQKVFLRIGDAGSDLYLRPGSTLDIRFDLPKERSARSVGKVAPARLLFNGLDLFDINALTSDINERFDAFLAEDLATDQAAGMQATDIIRRTPQPVDTIARPPTLFVEPNWSSQRVDTFEMQLRRFYGEVDDPWFMSYLEYGIASMRHGPRVNDHDLHARYLKGKPVQYDDPEYVRFVRSLFTEHIDHHVMRHHAEGWLKNMAVADIDSMKTLFARYDLLSEDDRLCELVMLDQLYLEYNGKRTEKGSVASILRQATVRSNYPEHRKIATNMLWDLTAMKAGERLPALQVQDLRGRDVVLDSLLTGPLCIVVTAAWCTYCDLELAGLEQLHAEYKDLVPIIAISLDPELEAVKKYVKQHPKRDFQWLHAPAGYRLREDLRIRSMPTFYLLNDGVLVSSPAPMPSTGLGAWFHRVKVENEQGNKLKVWDE